MADQVPPFFATWQMPSVSSGRPMLPGSGARGSNFMLREHMGRHATVVERTPFGAQCMAQLFDGLIRYPA